MNMTKLTYEQITSVVGPAHREKVEAIIASGASLKDLMEAQALISEESDIAGEGERQVGGHVMEVYVILTSGAA